MSDILKELYHEVILKHNSEPLNFEKREDATFCVEAYNPVCGDQFNLYFDLEEERIVNLSFHGYGCAISKASISILIQLINGKPINEVHTTNHLVKELLLNDGSQYNLPKELAAFAPVRKHSGRIKCVTLGWDSLIEFLENIK